MLVGIERANFVFQRGLWKCMGLLYSTRRVRTSHRKEIQYQEPLRDGAGSFHQVFRDSVCLRLFEHEGVF